MIGRPAIHCALFKAVAVLVMTVVMLIGRESSELGDLPGAKSMGNGATATSEYDRLFLPHVARSAADSNVVDRVVIGESGKVSLSAGLMIVDLSRVYSNPVVFVGPLPRDVRKDADVALVSITDVQPNRFALRIKEAPGEQGLRPYEESVDYLVIEAGEWQIDDHVVLSVGVLSVSLSWTPVSFPVIFDGIPVILTQAQSDRSRAWLTTRQQSSSATGFQVRLQGDGAFSGLDEAETVGWLAVSAGQGVWDGIGYQARLESIKGSQRFEFGEQERVSPVFASIASSNGGNHAHLRQWNAYPYAAVSSVYFPTSTYHLPDDVVVEATVEATGLTSLMLRSS